MKKLTLIVMMLLSSSLLPAQGEEAVFQAEPLKITVDYARFYGDSVQSFVELFYAFSESMLSYRQDSAGYKGELNFKMNVKKGGVTEYQKEWVVPHHIPQDAGTTVQSLVGIQSFAIKPGEYTLAISAKDNNDPGRNDSVQLPLLIVGYPQGQEFLSDIELCMSIQSSSDKQSIFYKNTLEVIPNPSNLYGTGMPVLYYYATAYNLQSRGVTDSLIVRTSIADALGKELFSKEKVKPRLYNASVEIGTMNVSSLKTGIYHFRMLLTDSLGGVIAQGEKKFFIYKVGTTPDSTITIAASPVSESRYGVMSLEEVDQYFEYAKYLSSDVEKEQYEQLTDLKAKQKFLYEFWKRRSFGPEPVNDEVYYQRIKSADEQFTTPFRSGWKSDRGRVAIMYGQYDEIERFSNSTDSNPYEIWQFHNLQGGVIFIFVDREGIGNYMLVHSTHRDEMHEDLWYEKYALKMH